ncbi:hypothetical protein L1049_007116 [Liquidambar formosana]|uniref:Ninja-family protein n=1 Tax=Liquidambar formosana TaxID=63359 RepID=A0AAP0WUL2_LIQFO
MAEAEGGGTLQTGHFSVQMSNLQRDLLQRFIPGGNHFRRKFEELTKETEEIELSLGLSLNGRFGVDPQANKLARSSSIPDFMNPARRNDETASVTAEEWRKRKELQSLRRMEAKRKRTEKQRNLRAARDRNRCDLEENCEEDKRVKDIGSLPIHGDEQYKPSETPNLVAPSSWVGGGRGGGGFNGGGIESRSEKGNGLVGGGLEGLLPPPPPPSQLSQGSGHKGAAAHLVFRNLRANQYKEQA